MDHLHKMFFAVVSCHAGSMTQILFINDRIFIATHICGWLRAVTKTRCSHPQSCDCGSECHHNEMTQVGQGEQCYELWALKLPTPAPSPHPAPRRVKLQLDNNRTLVHLTLPAIAAFTSRLSKTCILSSLTHDDICFPVHSKLLHNTQLCDAIYRRYWSHRIQSRDRI